VIHLAAIVLGQNDWLLPAAGAFAVALVWIGFSYVRSPASPGLKLGCALLKLLGLAALLACLLEPMWSGQRARPGANLFAVLADNSQGLTIKDRGAGRSRGEELRDLLTGPAARWPAALALNFQPRYYTFDARLQSTRDFSELDFRGRATAIGGALRSLRQRYEGQPLAGVLLFTDGIATDAATLEADLAGLPPVYPVLIGRDEPATDLAILKTSVSQTPFEDTPVTITAEVAATGYAGTDVVGWLERLYAGAPAGGTMTTNTAPSAAAAARPLEQVLRAPRDERLSFRFQFRPERSGVLFYRLRVSARGEEGQFAAPAASREATLANNERVIVVNRDRGPYRILYVSGRPNWEYKFLNRSLEFDDQVQLVGLIRIAKREAKFEFRGRAGESSNPLFRGFGNQSPEEIERYDQPVLVRLNTRDEFELRDGFPKAPEELFQYHAVILDDLEAAFFTADQMALLQRFVSERGGGLLMLGGQESLGEGRYLRTPVGDILPVYLDQQPEPLPETPLQLKLTREGWLQPWVRLRDTEAAEKKRLAEIPPLQVVNRLRGIKPGAMVLATVTDGRTDYPALVAQRYGHGKTAVLAIGDLWRTGLGDEARQQDLGKSWRQIVRWLVADAPARVELTQEPAGEGVDEAVRLLVRARDEKFLPLDNAVARVAVQRVSVTAPDVAATNRPAALAPLSLTGEPSDTQAGLYQTVFTPRESAGYLATAQVTDEKGAAVGRAETGWATDFAAAEFASVTPNRALLELVARKTGGELVEPARLERFVSELATRRAPVTEPWLRPLWHTPAMFLLALGCFVAEWGLRRWKGLA
jgi:uncharacterized membrane protein